MLTKIYRYGPSRQRLSKGWLLHGPDPEKVRARLEKLPRSSEIETIVERDGGTVVRLDTGMVWMHVPEARRRIFAALTESFRAISACCTEAGHRLLPCAVRPRSDVPWRFCLCGDDHVLEVEDESEKAAFCNLLRLHTPALVAMTGRAGAGPEGVEAMGSRRLSDSLVHHALPFLPCASPGYLRTMERCLTRDVGIPSASHLDVVPDPASPSVALRFVDGQMLLDTVRAHSLLFQALRIRARRMVRQGLRTFPTDQRRLETARRLAVVDGMGARFRLEDGVGKPTKEPVPAVAAVLDLLHDLCWEFQVLEVEYAEIAPLWLGCRLRQLGLGGVIHETDLLRLLHRGRRSGDTPLHETVAGLMGSEESLTRWNERAYPEESGLIRQSTEALLRFEAPDRLSAERPDDLLELLLKRTAAVPPARAGKRNEEEPPS